MKKVITNYRYWLLLIIGLVALTGIFAVPNDDLDPATFAWVLFSTKAVGFGAFYLMARLIRRWEKRGTIQELIDFANNF